MRDVQITRLDPQAYRRTPWKNGGGVTIDIADLYDPGAEPGGWVGIVWRLGRTRIERSGPFSDLSGHDRILTVIGGHGLMLDVEGAPAIDVRVPLRPVRFPGAWRITSRLEAGPVEVLNLIASREAVDIDVVILEAASAKPLSSGVHVLYAIAASAGAVGEENLELALDHAVRIESTRPCVVNLRSGCLALVSIIANQDEARAPNLRSAP